MTPLSLSQYQARLSDVKSDTFEIATRSSSATKRKNSISSLHESKIESAVLSRKGSLPKVETIGDVSKKPSTAFSRTSSHANINNLSRNSSYNVANQCAEYPHEVSNEFQRVSLSSRQSIPNERETEISSSVLDQFILKDPAIRAPLSESNTANTLSQTLVHSTSLPLKKPAPQRDSYNIPTEGDAPGLPTSPGYKMKPCVDENKPPIHLGTKTMMLKSASNRELSRLP